MIRGICVCVCVCHAGVLHVVVGDANSSPSPSTGPTWATGACCPGLPRLPAGRHAWPHLHHHHTGVSTTLHSYWDAEMGSVMVTLIEKSLLRRILLQLICECVGTLLSTTLKTLSLCEILASYCFHDIETIDMAFFILSMFSSCSGFLGHVYISISWLQVPDECCEAWYNGQETTGTLCSSPDDHLGTLLAWGELSWWFILIFTHVIGDCFKYLHLVRFILCCICLEVRQ